MSLTHPARNGSEISGPSQYVFAISIDFQASCALRDGQVLKAVGQLLRRKRELEAIWTS